MDVSVYFLFLWRAAPRGVRVYDKIYCTCYYTGTDQVEAGAVREELDVRSSTVDPILEVDLVPGAEEEQGLPTLCAFAPT